METLTFCSLPSFSKKASRGAFRPSVQLARKALNMEEEAIPRVLLPTRSKKYVKRNTVSTAMRIETRRKMGSCVKLYPVTDFTKKMGMVHKVGCKREEKNILPGSAKDVVENTNKRSIRAPQKPKKKNLTQRFVVSRKTLIRLPRKITPNHIRQEKRERAEQRLKLKIGSPFIELRLTTMSDAKVKERKIPPNVMLRISPL